MVCRMLWLLVRMKKEGLGKNAPSAEEKGKDLEKKGMYSEGSTFMGGEL